MNYSRNDVRKFISLHSKETRSTRVSDLAAFEQGEIIVTKVLEGYQRITRHKGKEQGIERFQSDLANSGLKLSLPTLHAYKHLFLGAHSPESLKQLERKYLVRVGEICDDLSVFKVAIAHALRTMLLNSEAGGGMEKLDKIQELAAPVFRSLEWNPRTWDLSKRGILELKDDPPGLLLHFVTGKFEDKEAEWLVASFMQMMKLVKDIEANTNEYLPLLCIHNPLFKSEDEMREMLRDYSLVMISDDDNWFPVGAKASDKRWAKTVRGYKMRQIWKEKIHQTLSQETPETLSKLPIICGRAEEKLADNTLFVPRMIDAVITDPPYGDDQYAEWRPHLKREIDSPETVKEAADLVANVAAIILDRKLVKPDFVWLQFMPMEAVHIFVPRLEKEFEKRKLDFKYQLWIWNKEKTPKVGGYRSTTPRLEAIAYFNFGRPLSQRIGGKEVWMHDPLFVCKTDSKGNFWKPVPLLEKLVQLVTYDDSRGRHQIILDPFAGRGSAGVAAIKCKRDFRLIESNQAEFQKCQANILEAQRKNRL